VVKDPQVIKRELAEVSRILNNHFGEPCWEGFRDPLEVLIRTILSQNTNDRNRDMAYQRLVERFPTWEALLEADVQEVAEAIRPAGLANQKSQRLKDILRWIQETYGRLDLDFICHEPVDSVIRTFCRLKGVGIKTISVVLLFACGRDIFPVDTHIHRIARRLGWVPEKASAEKTHQLLQGLVPPGQAYALHLNLLKFGRTICLARNPRCNQCILVQFCLSCRQGRAA